MPRTPRQTHGRRALAAAAAAGLLVSLFAPWYRWTVVAPGIHGLRTLTLTRSGWQAFSATELVIVVVAAVTLLLAIAMPADDQQAGAPRPFGVVVTVLGAIAFVVVLARLTTAPGTTRHALAETMVAIRWGIFLALACCAALTVAGLRLIRAPQPTATSTERTGRPARGSRRERVPRSSREPRAGRLPRQERAPRADRTSAVAAPSDDLTAPPTPERRPERARPTRRTDRPLWDEQATGWLDLPD